MVVPLDKRMAEKSVKQKVANWVVEWVASMAVSLGWS